MVAYNFKPRFVEMIEDGRKRQTIRAHRRRHARPGEPLQLYVGMRTAHCRKIIADPRCIDVQDVRIWVPRHAEPAAVSSGGRLAYVTPEFARADGFTDVEDFTRFWFDTHGPGTFSGVLIRWEHAATAEPEP
ncbi:MAG: hypothetical protein AAFW69_07335 [Pseudomonadota bacterium]